jgi:hypothetical protein
MYAENSTTIIALQVLGRTAFAALPHLDRLHSHALGVALSPSRQPLAGSVPESPLRVGGSINPGFVSDVVPENVSIVSIIFAFEETHKNDVEDEVEVLVERRVAGSGCALRPRVGEEGLVLGHFLKLAKLVKRLLLLVTNEEDLLDPAVDVEVDVVLGPLHAVGVVAVGVVAAADLLHLGGTPVSIGLRGRAWF